MSCCNRCCRPWIVVAEGGVTAPGGVLLSNAVSDTLLLEWCTPTLECRDPEMWLLVLIDRNLRRGLRRRWSLYSTGPCCGSGHKRLTLRCCDVPFPFTSRAGDVGPVPWSGLSDDSTCPVSRMASSHGDRTSGVSCS